MNSKTNFVLGNNPLLTSQERGILMCQELTHLVTSQTDSFVKQSDLMNLLQLSDENKSMLTRCVKKCFPDAKKKIITVNHELQ